VLETLSDTMKGLIEAASQLQKDAPPKSQLDKIVARGEFRPTEDEAIGFWFARFLSVRESLWTVIEDVRIILDGPPNSVEKQKELHYFLLGYAAVCLLIRIDRLMLFEVAHHSVIQRKLNEPFPEYRIPRKQYTTIFSAFVDQTHVFAIRDAMKFRRKNRRKLLLLSTDQNVGSVARQIHELESSLNPSKLRHLKRAWSYVVHKWRRRGAVSVANILAGVMEGVGRTASEFCDFDNKRVSDDVLSSITEFLQPGDVIVTRHAKALTNLFIPGFWPHAALYIGTQAQHESTNIDADLTIKQLWVDDICVLLHQGKMYNFDFDFFSSDRIVCTEVVYRAYDGLEDLRFPLNERAGRKTLSAEDLLDFALDTEAFTPVAIFGVEGCGDAVMYGDVVNDALIESYRNPS